MIYYINIKILPLLNMSLGPNSSETYRDILKQTLAKIIIPFDFTPTKCKVQNLPTLQSLYYISPLILMFIPIDMFKSHFSYFLA